MTLGTSETQSNLILLNRFALVFTPLLISIEFFLFILFRKVNLDEGWYLWASKLVYQGQVLYRDFTYTQTPLLPYVYGLWQQVAGEGLMAGRILTTIFGLLTALVGALVVRNRLAKRILAKRVEWGQDTVSVGVLGFGLLFGTSVYAIAYLSYTATYGLTCFLLTSGCYYALAKDRSTNDGLMSALLSLAAATRLSALPFLPVLAIYRIWQSTNRLRTTIVILGVFGIVLAMVVTLGYISSPQMVYDIFGFHTDRVPSMVRQFWRMVRTTQNTAQAYGMPLLLILSGCAMVMGRSILTGSARAGSTRAGAVRAGVWGGIVKANSFEIGLIVASMGSYALHLWPRTTDAYYNTMLFPIWAILASLALAYIYTRWAHSGIVTQQRTTKQLGLILLGLAVINFLLQADAIRRNDLFRFPAINQLQTVSNAADFLARTDRNDNQLLTLNTHLALESGMNVPSGYEMSIFSYRPDWSTEQAEQFMVVNNQMLVADLAAGVDAVAVSDFDIERFYGDRQLIFDTLNQHYRLSKTVPEFDPFYNNLYIYLPPQFSALAPEHALSVELENGISLLGYDLEKGQYKPGDDIFVGLYWRSNQVPARTYTVFMHLLDASGNVIFGWDNPPCRTTCPTDSWAAGEVLRDEYTLKVPEDALHGLYRIRTGMYNSDTARGILTRSQGDFIQDGRLIVLDEIEIGE